MPARKKCSDEALISDYARTNSVWVTAKNFSMCGQSVWERLRKHGKTVPVRRLSDLEKVEIETLYRSGFLRGDGQLNALSKKINRTVPFISRYAGIAGLVNAHRTFDSSLSMSISVRAAKWHTEHPGALEGDKNPMFGKKHTPERLKQMSEASKAAAARMTPLQKLQKQDKMMKTKYARYGSNNPARSHGSWKAGWREIGGLRVYFRSRWEANYARYLEFLRTHGEIVGWEHEPQTFWFEKIRRGVRSYLPDFRVTLKCKEENLLKLPDFEYHEVKGWMDARSRTTINRMRIYHPNVKLVIIDKEWFKRTGKQMSGLITDWEKDR